MSRNSEGAFSRRTLDLSEKFQEFGGKAVEPIVRAFAGSSNPAYTQLNWRKQAHLSRSDLGGVLTIDGDPEAGLLPRTWKTAVVLGTSQDELDRRAETASEFGELDVQEAVAYVSDDTVRIGTMPDSDDRLFARQHPFKYFVAMRLGPKTLRATMGLWIPEDGEFIQGRNVHVYQIRSQDQIAQAYPDIRIV